VGPELAPIQRNCFAPAGMQLVPTFRMLQRLKTTPASSGLRHHFPFRSQVLGLQLVIHQAKKPHHFARIFAHDGQWSHCLVTLNPCPFYVVISSSDGPLRRRCLSGWLAAARAIIRAGG
jgi:hypothetical protein